MSTITHDLTTEILKPGDLEQLAKETSGPCVSILMRTHRKGAETQQGSIRLKNLISKAEKQLKDNDHDPSVLDSIRSLITNADFWQNQQEGLAIFLTPDNGRLFSLNRELPDSVHVGDAYRLAPLTPDYGVPGDYFVLALTWDEAKLFRSSDGTLTTVETETLPGKYHDFVIPRDPEKSLQNTSHRRVGNAPGTSTAMFHGHGEGEDKVEADRDQYLSLVGEQVAGAVYNSGRPLIIVGTKEMIGKFEATTHVNADAKVEGSPAQWSEHELNERVREYAEESLQESTQDFSQRFGTALANSQGSNKPSDVLKAAREGRVESLLINSAMPNDGELNANVTETLRNGGLVSRSDMDNLGDAKLAAIYRY
ncbi:hypothetical protein FHS27_000134 [Rhodopirellula rubra]|uniref:Uncharacterized protein n=1 Tax=Aporhodopirellula rubra TaxID=980271 RepID=A0A7W5H3Y4_9BACT|nr:hypothetical protein [Aporhodopirellula rubra]MBB3204370.1 hypothetical protein [Aporhodopirellula rubra]